MPDQSKSEKATPHKRMEQKKKGNAFQSKDLISGILILASFFALRMLAAGMFSRFRAVIHNFIGLGGNINEINTVTAANIMFELVTNLLLLVLPILAVAMVLGVLFSTAQTRIAFTAELLQFKFSRINPIEGFKRMFSLKSLFELAKSLVKVTVIVIVVYWVINGRLNQIPNLLLLDVPNGVLWILDTVFWTAMYAGIAMLVIGVVDFFYQWWDHERNLMMSKQEIKDEYKQLEGDPLIKAHRDSLRRQRARERMMSAVKESDVVVRNPEHYAVALKYNLEMKAPAVVAKGRDFIAQQILNEAAKHNIYTVENPPLAQALYKTVGIDMEIPEQFWSAVVEIIAHIMVIKGQDLNKISEDIENKKQQTKQTG